MKFLKAVQLDITDGRMFGVDTAAEGEWVVSGSYAVSGPAAGERSSRTYRDNNFVGVASHGGSSIADACEIDVNLVAVSRCLELTQVAENLPGKLRLESAITFPERPRIWTLATGGDARQSPDTSNFTAG